MPQLGRAVLKRLPALLGDSSAEGKIAPSLVHGDFWIGNTGASADRKCAPAVQHKRRKRACKARQRERGVRAGATPDGVVVFDPAAFYGHAEFDLALARIFSGFTDDFYDTYFALRPKAEGFEAREQLYSLYHFLHQLNLFRDPQVRNKCVGLMQGIAGPAV